MSVPIIRRRAELAARIAEWRAEGARIGVVPTMGALHAGHLSLVEGAKAGADRVIVTLFVNPRQFNSPEDYAKYPRTEEADAAILAPAGVDALYVPEPEEIYPPGFATSVSVSGLTEVLCGAHRPGHFDGVATVVTKLFRQTGADAAWFGEKDFQQLLLVRRLSADLDLGVEVVACPTIRETDGLALSSRNARLSPEARGAAAALPREMAGMAEALGQGAAMTDLVPDAEARLRAAGFTQVEYLELRAADDLRLLDRSGAPARLFAAAWIGGVRLIDNIAVSG
ncbi:pantoate--beta-alanine ligase [Roseivivax halodurans JCM 10272]|uniref:Pantothenate synthetase n=1 Tax=Roseivivax halodurans JCM 10272 TaxID=1449350 RepID=X7EFL2_9RHOB|nr:pantoate--beta-alanine ligase [Roseivivax halodurans]ETX14864.1 pantoate--beta-alanine ligase [Roseivivax halodurans JCM 10272]